MLKLISSLIPILYQLWGLRLAQRCWWRCKASGMWGWTIRWVIPPDSVSCPRRLAFLVVSDSEITLCKIEEMYCVEWCRRDWSLKDCLLFALRTEGNFNRHHLEWAEVKTLYTSKIDILSQLSYLPLILGYFCPENGGSIFLSNICTHLPAYTLS
jgi:hypothetical protein